MTDGPTLPPKERIAILMAEYNAIRAEILQKSNTGSKLLGIGCTVAIATTAIVASNSSLFGIALFPVLALVLWVARRNIQFSMLEFGTHILKIEEEVNRLAGAKLLTWESERGGIWPEKRRRKAEYVFGPLLKIYRRIRSLPRPPSN